MTLRQCMASLSSSFDMVIVILRRLNLENIKNILMPQTSQYTGSIVVLMNVAKSGIHM